MTLTGAGGVIALVLVKGLVLLIRLTLAWKGAVPLWAAAAGIIVSISIGLIFGVWPATKAQSSTRLKLFATNNHLVRKL